MTTYINLSSVTVNDISGLKTAERSPPRATVKRVVSQLQRLALLTTLTAATVILSCYTTPL